MELNIADSAAPLPCQRSYAVSMVIRSFKGRRDVEVHLFRPQWDKAEETALNAKGLVGAPLEGAPSSDPATSRRVILESFTLDERNQLVEYLKEHYATRLTAINSTPLDFPVPAGLPALCDMEEGKTIGFIRFEKIPHFNLPFAVRGLYDLNQHKPIVEGAGG